MRLQGTDGIRGRIRHGECSNPVQMFIEESTLTESFFELYTYAYCCELLESGFAQEGDSVVIGWDPRDQEGRFNQAAIQGIMKAGLKAYSVGMLPTPAIVLYTLQVGAKCGFMLTASHNPSDQNGIKIFLGSSGLKLFSNDEVRLTQRLLELDSASLRSLPPKGGFRDHSEQAQEDFIAFSTASENTWITPEVFSNITLIIDASNGAYSNTIRPILEKLSINAIYTNCDATAPINHQSGVADFEGLTTIQASEIESPSAHFYAYETLQTLLKEGRQQQQPCAAMVFDGDGDRFFRLDYDRSADQILVSTGDPIAYWQAAFLKKAHEWKATPLFVNTVESDLETSRAAQQQGYAIQQTAVGDKWILWEAVKQSWLMQSQLYLESIDTPNLRNTITTWQQELQHLPSEAFDTLRLTQQWLHLQELFLQEGGSSEQLDTITETLLQPGIIPFAAGAESSGHAITLGKWQTDQQSGWLYAGNGLKSALNAFSAIYHLGPSFLKNDAQRLNEPYSTGYQQSLPVYYVNKSLLNPGTSFRTQLEELIQSKLSEVYSEQTVEKVDYPEEPEMLYFRVLNHDQWLGTLFVRNSGTEDKLSLYIRGCVVNQTQWESLSEDLYLHLLRSVKNTDSAFAQAEQSILQQLQESPLSSNQLQLPEEIIASKNRLLHEMSSKQKLIVQNDDHFWQLTSRGKTLC